MAEIHNLKELNKLGRNLEYGDCICFTTKDNIIKYNVVNYFLQGIGFSDSVIFDFLDLNEEEKIKLAEKYYKYKVQNRSETMGTWPEYKLDDFQALERLIREIYKRLRDNNIKINNEDYITNRFEILDL